MENLNDGEIGLIMQKDGRIIQLAIHKDIRKAIMFTIASLSQDTPLMKTGEEYDLVLKSTVEKFKKKVCGHNNIGSVAGITTCLDCNETLCDY